MGITYMVEIIMNGGCRFGDRSSVAAYNPRATIGARERVYEPGQDRKIATALHVSVMCFRSSYTALSYAAQAAYAAQATVSSLARLPLSSLMFAQSS